MAEIEALQAAIDALEAQRSTLGDAAVDAALAPLRERIAALQPTSTAGERKQITVLFADLSGFTALSERTDAEVARNLANLCFERIGQVVRRYGGYIDKFIGDELMVLFGAPVAMEDHAARALHTAQDIRETFTAFSREHPQLQDHPLDLHFGVNSGLVVAGAIGTESKREYTVMGDPVNVAARLVANAQGGEILVGEATRRLVGDHFSFDDLGLTEFKGRAEPQRVFRLVSAVHGPAARRAGAKLIGRREEIGILVEAFQDVASGARRRSVLVVGSAGIGKSRLVSEFRTWLADESPATPVLQGAAFPHMTATPYFLIAELLRDRLGVRESDSAAEVRARLELALVDLAISAVDVLHGLAAIMAVEYPDDALQQLPAEERRARIFAAFETFVQATASGGPVLLQLEDVHWADDLSLDVLEHVFGGMSRASVMFLSMSRPVADTDSKLRQVDARMPKDRHTSVVLRELDENASSLLVSELAPEASADMVRAIVLKGQGNPFFIEEIVATLMDQGLLTRGDHAPSGDSGDLGVPDTVWGVLAERIDRLPVDEKHVIQAAAIVGRVFWQDLVKELANVEPDPPLSALSRRDFVDFLGPAAFENDWEWSFRHVLVQEVAYEGLLREARKVGHLAAAAWLERRAGDRRNEYATLLAHHYELGEDWSKTAEFAELAGDRASALYAHGEARGAYSQALRALSRCEPDVAVARRRIDVTLKLARVAYYAPTEDVLQALEEARQVAEDIGDEEWRIRVMAGIASWQYMAGQTRPAVVMALQVIAGATEKGLEDLLVVPYLIVGRALVAMADYGRAIEMIEKSTELGEKYRDELDTMPIETRSGAPLSFLGMAYQLSGHLERGAELGESGLRIAEENRDLTRISSAHLVLGAPACLFGRLDDAEKHLRPAIAMAEETGDLSVVYVALGFLGHWHSQRNELEQGGACLDRSLAIAADLDALLYVSMIEAFRAELDVKLGRFDAALARATQAVAIGKETRQEGCEAQAHRVLGWATYYAGPDSHELAEAAFREAIAIQERISERLPLARTLYELSDFLRLADDVEGAQEAEAAASAIKQELGLHWLPMPSPAPAGVGVRR
jgi:class 3 adenylate cyclase/tetratricopeptide (TPR) repeat protein